MIPRRAWRRPRRPPLGPRPCRAPGSAFQSLRVMTAIVCAPGCPEPAAPGSIQPDLSRAVCCGFRPGPAPVPPRPTHPDTYSHLLPAACRARLTEAAGTAHHFTAPEEVSCPETGPLQVILPFEPVLCLRSACLPPGRPPLSRFPARAPSLCPGVTWMMLAPLPCRARPAHSTPLHMCALTCLPLRPAVPWDPAPPPHAVRSQAACCWQRPPCPTQPPLTAP